LLKETPDPKRPSPTKTFDKDFTLTVGDQTLELSYKGENHSTGNIFIYAPKQKVVMIIDLVYSGWVPYAQLAHSSFLPGWINAHNQILAYDFKYYIGGISARPEHART
jgi:hypothetical protein